MSEPAPVITSDPEILSGTPVFVGTRVPFQTARLPGSRAAPLRVPGGLPDRVERARGHRSGTGEGRSADSCMSCLTSACRDDWSTPWTGTKCRSCRRWGGPASANGELLRLAAREFDVFLTVDQRLQQEQQLSMFRIAVIVLVARSNRLLDLLLLRQKLQYAPVRLVASIREV